MGMSFIREYIVKAYIDPIRGKRSKHWRKTRKAFLKTEGNGVCAYCGSKSKLQVHHEKDWSTNPELELEFSNLITLCMKNKCHIVEGHLQNWKSINPDIRADCNWHRQKVANRRK